MLDLLWDILKFVIDKVFGCVMDKKRKIDITLVDSFCTFIDWSSSKRVFFYENPNCVIVQLSLIVTNAKEKVSGISYWKVFLEYGDRSIQLSDGLVLEGYVENVENNIDELINIPKNFTKRIFYTCGFIQLPDSDKLKNGYKIVLKYQVIGEKNEREKLLYIQQQIK